MIADAFLIANCLYVGYPNLISIILFLANNIGDYDAYTEVISPIVNPT